MLRPCPPLASPRPSPHTHPPRKHHPHTKQSIITSSCIHPSINRLINQPLNQPLELIIARADSPPSLVLCVHVYMPILVCLCVSVSVCICVSVRRLCRPPRPPPLCRLLRAPTCRSWPTPHTSSSHCNSNSQVLHHSHTQSITQDTHKTDRHTTHTHIHAPPQTERETQPPSSLHAHVPSAPRKSPCLTPVCARWRVRQRVDVRAAFD